MRMQPAEISHLLQEVPLGHKSSWRMELKLARGCSCQGEQGKEGFGKLLLLPCECGSLGPVNQARPPLIADVTQDLLQETLSQLKVSHGYQMALS